MQLHKQAQECLTMLSNRLGDKEYFFGKSPSTIDAIIFSYLLLLLKVNNWLFVHKLLFIITILYFEYALVK